MWKTAKAGFLKEWATSNIRSKRIIPQVKAICSVKTSKEKPLATSNMKTVITATRDMLYDIIIKNVRGGILQETCHM